MLIQTSSDETASTGSAPWEKIEDLCGAVQASAGRPTVRRKLAPIIPNQYQALPATYFRVHWSPPGHHCHLRTCQSVVGRNSFCFYSRSDWIYGFQAQPKTFIFHQMIAEGTGHHKSRARGIPNAARCILRASFAWGSSGRDAERTSGVLPGNQHETAWAPEPLELINKRPAVCKSLGLLCNSLNQVVQMQHVRLQRCGCWKPNGSSCLAATLTHSVSKCGRLVSWY